jgi:hypothetical protein
MLPYLTVAYRTLGWIDAWILDTGAAPKRRTQVTRDIEEQNVYE